MENLTVSHQDTLSLDFGAGVVVDVDLSTVRMTERQRQILDKLISKKATFTLEECADDACPAANLLSKDEFEEIRQVKATLGTDERLAGLICDFCLKCVSVGQ